jgi:hypothetical protein
MKFHENNFSDFWSVNICMDKQIEITIGTAQVCKHAWKCNFICYSPLCQ